MKLFLVIYVAGFVNSSAGPLPITMDECRAANLNWSKAIMADFAAKGFSAKVKCEWHEDHPKVDSPERARG